MLRPATDHVTEAFDTTAPNWFLTVATIATEPSGARRTPDAGVNATVVEVIAGTAIDATTVAAAVPAPIAAPVIATPQSLFNEPTTNNNPTA